MPSEAQALSMSKYYNIPLSPEQVAGYISERQRMDEVPVPYDSAIFERVLTPEQKKLFLEKRLNHSSSPKSPQSRLSIHPLPI